MTGKRANRPLVLVEDAHLTRGTRKVLNGAHLGVRRGEIVVLLGPNGSGKSTLVKAISGRLRLDSGTLLVGGRDPARDVAARRLAGLVPQHIALFEKLTARENLLAFGRLMGVPGPSLSERADQVLKLVGLTARARERADILSGGMRRLLNIGAGLMHAPGLLILDEPTVGIDLAARRRVQVLLRALRKGGMAVLLTTHDLDEAEALADRVSIIVDGVTRQQGRVPDLIAGVFRNRHHVRVVLADRIPKPGLAETETALAGVGLARETGTNVWSGLVEGSEDDIADLMGDLMFAEARAREVRVRKPGLDALMSTLTGEAKP